MDDNLKNGKTAIVVGGSSGIGLATAKLLLSKGYDVTNISRALSNKGSDLANSKAEEKALQQNLNNFIKTVNADVSIQGQLTKAIKLALKDSSLDVLIYSAGCSMAAPIQHADPSDYRYLFDVNFFGALEAISTAIPFMKQNGGRIVLVSSLAGTFPIAFDSFYSASKAALDMLALAADQELKDYKIRVNAIKPGGVSTDFTFKRNVYGTDLAAEYAQKQKSAVAALAKIEKQGLSAEKVAQSILSVIQTSNPPTVEAIGIKNKACLFAARVLPNRLTQLFNSWQY